MSTGRIEHILTKVEKLSTEEKKFLIKRVVDLIGETGPPPATQRTLPPSRRRETGLRPSQQRAALHKEVAAYAQQHGGGPDRLDLDAALEAASVEYLVDADVGIVR